MALRVHHAPSEPETTPPRLSVRPAVCPRCQGCLIQEPGASRCRMCGRIFYLIDHRNAQRDYEESSGLARRALQSIIQDLNGLSRLGSSRDHRPAE